MSHIAKIDLVIKDLDSLAAACKARGLELVRDQKQYKWYQGQSECDHAIRQTGETMKGYEIGLKYDRAAGGYELLWDDYDRALRTAAGPKAAALKQEYSAAVATKHYARNGYRVERQVKADGKIVLTATR